MTPPIKLGDITIHRVVEQEGAWFDAFNFFPTLSKELFEENRSWLEPRYFSESKIVLCVQSYLVRTPHHNILVNSCVGNHKPRPARPMWNMMEQRPITRRTSRPPASASATSITSCARICMSTMSAGTRGSRTGAGCRRSRKPNTCLPTASSRSGPKGTRRIRRNVRGSTDSVLPIVEAKRARDGQERSHAQ